MVIKLQAVCRGFATREFESEVRYVCVDVHSLILDGLVGVCYLCHLQLYKLSSLTLGGFLCVCVCVCLCLCVCVCVWLQDDTERAREHRLLQIREGLLQKQARFVNCFVCGAVFVCTRVRVRASCGMIERQHLFCRVH